MEIKKVKIDKDNFIWDKISTTAAGAAKGEDYIPESHILKDEWGTNDGEVEFEKRDDGTYLILDNGVAMGFTDETSANSIINPSTTTSDRYSDAFMAAHEPESPIKNSKNVLEKTLKNIDARNKSETLQETLKKVNEEKWGINDIESAEKQPSLIEKLNQTVENPKKSMQNKVSPIVKDQTIDYNSPEYQEKLLQSVDSFNQVDGVVSEYLVEGYPFRSVGCGTASLMTAYAMLSGDFEFNPEEFVQDAIDQGYLSSSGSVSKILPVEDENNTLRNKWGLDATPIDGTSESIINALKEGEKVMFNININDGYYASGAGHYVLLDHYDENTNQIYVFDPAAREGGRPVERMGYHDVKFLEDNMFNVPNNAPLAIKYNKQ